MRKITRITCLLAFLFISMMQAKAEDPIRKENALKAEQLTSGKIVLFKGVGNNNTKWINWENRSTEKPEARCLFMIEWVNSTNKDEGFRLKRLTDNKYIGGTKSNNSPIQFKQNSSEATIFVIDQNATTDQHLTLPTGAQKTDLYHLRYKVKQETTMYLNVQDGRDNNDSTPKYKDGPGSWSFVATYDAAKYAKDMLGNYKASEYNIGTGIGQYTDSDNTFTEARQTVTTTLQDLNAESPTAETIKQALEVAPTLETAINQLKINTPQPGYYRLKSVQYNNYIKAKHETKGNVPMTAHGPDAVFFLSAGNKLVTENFLCMNGIQLEAGLGTTVTFGKSLAKIGCYTINSNNKFFKAVAINSGNLGERTDENYAPTQTDCAWTLEPVEDANQMSLTKNFGTAEYSTISSPVALTIPEGVEAYKAIVSSDNASVNLKPIGEGKVLPAGVGAILKKTNTESTFTFNFSTYLGDAQSANLNNSLHPLYEDKVFAANSNAVYILAKDGNDYGFFLLWQEGSDEDRTVAKHKAYLELPVAPANALRSIMIGGATTGINSIETGKAENEVYFDLQGRRVNNPKKGLYITSKGKKVIFN